MAVKRTAMGEFGEFTLRQGGPRRAGLRHKYYKLHPPLQSVETGLCEPILNVRLRKSECALSPLLLSG